MSLGAEALETFVRRYLDTVANGTPTDVAALFAEDATLEDPVGGGEIHIGRHAIEGFYTQFAQSSADMKTELLNFRSGGHEAAFVFAITVGGSIRSEPIEVMSFDGDGKITSMKAFWSPTDIKQL